MPDPSVTRQWVEELRELLKAGKSADLKLAVGKLDQGLGPAIDRIRAELALYRERLIEALATLPGEDNLEQRQQLEANIGALQFDVERHLSGLQGRDLTAKGEPRASARLLIQADEALLALKNRLSAVYTERQRPTKEKLQTLLDKKQGPIATKQLDTDNKKKALDLHVERSVSLKDTSGRQITAPFDPTTRKFYTDAIARLEPLETASKGKKSKLGEAEIKLLQAARLMEAANKTRDQLKKSFDDANDELGKLKKDLVDTRKPLDEALERLKCPQEIRWAAPADITHGMPLSEAQLNATLSANSGTVQYYAAGFLIEPGKTLLPAGAAQLLQARVFDSERETFQETPPKEVRINVLKAKVNLSDGGSIEVGYGTPFAPDMLTAVLSTEPAVPTAHADLLAHLVLTADGKELNEGDLLDAKTWVLKLQSPERRSFHASAEVQLTLTVKPAQQQIDWEGAAPTTLSFGAPLSATQLNAKVSLSTKPPLPDRLADLSKALVYTDEKGAVVKIGSVLHVGEVRRITASAPARPNFLAATPKTLDLKIEKALRSLAAGVPAPVGAVVQSQDLKQLRKAFRFTAGDGEALFFIGSAELTTGAKLVAAKKTKLRVAVKPDDNYQPTAEQTADIEVLGAAEKFSAAELSSDTLVADALKVHSTHKQAIDALKQKVKDLVGGKDEDKFAAINELLKEAEEIEAKLVSWKKDPVPDAEPEGDGKALEIDATGNPTVAVRQQRTVQKLTEKIKHGGMTLAEVEKIVPKGTTNSFAGKAPYLKGFRYTWEVNGVMVTIYGHGPTVNDDLPDDTDSKKGNLVRIKVGSRYLLPDGGLTAIKKDGPSHMALY